jgi:hydroxymethylbilane synthase
LIRIGTRGSALARWQATFVAEHLRAHGHSVQLEVMVTAGDRVRNLPFAQVGNKGIFTKEIDEALASGRIDLAVHSLKDLPSALPPDFTLACVPRRADPRDAFLARNHASFAALPPQATVGTSSIRRQSLLRARRPDLNLIELRGNIDTRLRKLEQASCDAIVLAAAGLDRLGLDANIRERFAVEQMCPAAGQGALGIECRAGDTKTLGALATLEHRDARFAVTLERATLAALEGGCHVPIGVHCMRRGDNWAILGIVAAPDGSRLVRHSLTLPGDTHSAEDAADTGRMLAAHLLIAGAGEILNGAAAQSPPAGAGHAGA